MDQGLLSLPWAARGVWVLLTARIPFPCVNIFAVEQYTAFYLKFHKLAGCYYKRLLNCRLPLYI